MTIKTLKRLASKVLKRREKLKADGYPCWGLCDPLGELIRDAFISGAFDASYFSAIRAHSASIRLSTDLAKKPLECLEYLLVHEMLHLLEPTHNARFVALMDRYMPKWQQRRAALNRLPVRHENWTF